MYLYLESQRDVFIYILNYSMVYVSMFGIPPPSLPLSLFIPYLFPFTPRMSLLSIAHNEDDVTRWRPKHVVGVSSNRSTTHESHTVVYVPMFRRRRRRRWRRKSSLLNNDLSKRQRSKRQLPRSIRHSLPAFVPCNGAKTEVERDMMMGGWSPTV